jgi:DNA-binding response OmpR family regulator
MSKILIAEDDESTQELLKHIISSAGFEVATASDGQEALKAILGAQPDLVILDIMLPEVHGFSICHQIKSNDILKTIKVLMLSAKAFPADRRQAEEVGADAFLSKPVNPVELVNKVKSLLAT